MSTTSLSNTAKRQGQQRSIVVDSAMGPNASRSSTTTSVLLPNNTINTFSTTRAPLVHAANTSSLSSLSSLSSYRVDLANHVIATSRGILQGQTPAIVESLRTAAGAGGGGGGGAGETHTQLLLLEGNLREIELLLSSVSSQSSLSLDGGSGGTAMIYFHQICVKAAAKFMRPFFSVSSGAEAPLATSGASLPSIPATSRAELKTTEEDISNVSASLPSIPLALDHLISLCTVIKECLAVGGGGNNNNNSNSNAFS